MPTPAKIKRQGKRERENEHVDGSSGAWRRRTCNRTCRIPGILCQVSRGADIGGARGLAHASEKLDHSDVGADAVVKILKDDGFPISKIDAVRGSPAGRALVPQRKAELQQFLANLRSESDNLASL
jgi:hypothetical protein